MRDLARGAFTYAPPALDELSRATGRAPVMVLLVADFVEDEKLGFGPT